MDQDSNDRSKPAVPPLKFWQQLALSVVWFLVAGVFAVFITLALQAK